MGFKFRIAVSKPGVGWGGRTEIEPSCDSCCCEVNGKMWAPVWKEGSQRGRSGGEEGGASQSWGEGRGERNSDEYLSSPLCSVENWPAEDEGEDISYNLYIYKIFFYIFLLSEQKKQNVGNSNLAFEKVKTNPGWFK